MAGSAALKSGHVAITIHRGSKQTEIDVESLYFLSPEYEILANSSCIRNRSSRYLHLSSNVGASFIPSNFEMNCFLKSDNDNVDTEPQVSGLSIGASKQL
jgi:hypothetical protein